MQATHAGQATTRGGGTEGWQSPEVMVDEGATTASDIFSLGLLFFFVLTEGGHCFGELGAKRTRAMLRFATTDVDDAEEVGEADAKVAKRVAAAMGAGDAAAKLVSSMLRLEPGRRPSAREVLGSVLLREEEEATGAEEEEEESLRECCVCLDGEPTYAVLPCGHRCLCEGCRGAAKHECPVCRTPAQGTVRIFESGAI